MIERIINFCKYYQKAINWREPEDEEDIPLAFAKINMDENWDRLKPDSYDKSIQKMRMATKFVRWGDVAGLLYNSDKRIKHQFKRRFVYPLTDID